MTGQNMFDERGARSGHPQNKDLNLRRIAPFRSSFEMGGVKPRHDRVEMLRVGVDVEHGVLQLISLAIVFGTLIVIATIDVTRTGSHLQNRAARGRAGWIVERAKQRRKCWALRGQFFEICEFALAPA